MTKTITFNIQYENDKIETIELDQQSRAQLSEKDQQRFEDLGTSLINGVSAAVTEGFFGAAFEKDNVIVIAFRGTNNPLSQSFTIWSKQLCA